MRSLARGTALLALLAGTSHAQRAGPPGRTELRLEPGLGQNFGLIQPSGFQLNSPDNKGTDFFFGLGVALGYFLGPLVEPSCLVSFGIESWSNGPVTTVFGLVPSLKLNLWSTPHINPFFEPFLGVAVYHLSQPNSTLTFLDGGLYAGLELLISSWGIRVASGFEGLVSTRHHSIGIPVRWALVAFF